MISEHLQTALTQFYLNLRQFLMIFILNKDDLRYSDAFRQSSDGITLFSDNFRQFSEGVNAIFKYFQTIFRCCRNNFQMVSYNLQKLSTYMLSNNLQMLSTYFSDDFRKSSEEVDTDAFKQPSERFNTIFRCFQIIFRCY